MMTAECCTRVWSNDTASVTAAGLLWLLAASGYITALASYSIETLCCSGVGDRINSASAQQRPTQSSANDDLNVVDKLYGFVMLGFMQSVMD